MQQEHTSPKSVAKTFLAGLVAVLLLTFGVLATSHSLHHTLHHDRATGTSGCAICLLAQAHVELVDTASVLPIPVIFSPGGLLAASVGSPWGLDFLLPPGRAPPRLACNS